MKAKIIFTLALAAMLVLAAGELWAANLEVSQPKQVTNNSNYERGQSIIYDGANYWLFYGRSASVTENYGSGNPDVNDYVVYYKKETSIAGLTTSASAAPISGVARNVNGYLGETGAAYFGGEVWAFATIDIGATCDLYGWWTSDGGGTWNEVGPIVTGLSDGQAHHDEIAFNGELWVIEGSGDFNTIHSATPKTGGWSVPLNVDAALTGGLVHFFVDGSDLYLAINASGMNYIYKYNSVTVAWDKVDENAPPNKYDPTLFKVGSNYVFAQAPWDGTKQYILSWSGATLDNTFFNTTSKMVTEGAYGSNPWVDMWPIGFTDQGGTSYLFFTSERNPNDPSSEITGNIWYLKVDWDVSRDHHTYIQEAIDAANASDQINVAAGMYTEQVLIDKSLTLAGAGAATTTIQAPDPLAGDKAIVTITGASVDVELSGFTVTGPGPGTSNSIFAGIYVKGGANGNIHDNDILDIRDNPICGSQDPHGIWVGSGAKGTTGTATIKNNIITDYQKGGIAVEGSGSTATIENNIITGAGPISTPAQDGIRVAFNAGPVSIKGNTLSANEHDGADPWGGAGIFLYKGYHDIDIEDNTITANRVGILVDGDWNDATHPGDKVNITNNDITGQLGEGIHIQYIGWGGVGAGSSPTNVHITGNDIQSNYDTNIFPWYETQAWGIMVDYLCSSNTNYAHFNNIAGTPYIGLWNGKWSVPGDVVHVFDAEKNWWGSTSGPKDDSDDTATGGLSNPTGTGDAVSDNVDYDPWLGKTGTVNAGITAAITGPIFALDCHSTIKTGATEEVDLVFIGDHFKGVNAVISFNGDVVDFTKVEPPYTAQEDFSAYSTNVVNDASGSVTIDVIYTPEGEINNPGTVATMTFTGVGSGESNIIVTSAQVRDNNNQAIAGVVNISEQITVDDTAPTMESITETTGEYYKIAPTFASFGFVDETALDKGEFSVDGGLSWTTIFSGVPGTQWNGDGWALPAASWTALAEGTVTITFKVTDDAGNESSYNWQFYKDTIAPAAVAGASATPAGSVDLSWTAVPTGDYEFEHLEIRRNGWGGTDYPEYPSADVPLYPGNAEGTQVLTTTVGTTDSYKDPVVGTEEATRNIYYYQIFVWDKAGNVSVADASAQARATNYLLGDVAIAYDNTVNFTDLSAWSIAYGSSQSGGNPYNAEYDFGPTHNGNRLGIPQPWATQNHLSHAVPANTIQFEDLMIFAMNYQKTLTKSVSPLVTPPADQLAMVLDGKLSRQQSEKWVDVTVRIENNCQNVKAAYLVLAYDVSSLELKEVNSAGLFSQQGQTEFFHHVEEDGKVEISAAILGTGVGITNSGDIARLRFKLLNGGAGEISFCDVSLRDAENKDLKPLQKSLSINSLILPTKHDLAQNYPNPFNSNTTISYQLPEAGNTELVVFNINGQLVKTLVNEKKEAGRYQVIWNGCGNAGEHVSSGIYYYRIKSGNFSKLIKMVFLK